MSHLRASHILKRTSVVRFSFFDNFAIDAVLKCHHNAAHHDRCDLVKNGEFSALSAVASGKRNHKIVTHVENGKGKGIEKVI